LTEFAAVGLPIAAGLVGWLLLWRRNTIVYHARNIHFCGDDLFEKEFWAPSKQKRPPLIDTFELGFINLGLKHLDETHFLLHYMSDDAVYHPDHGNKIPACNFSFAVERPTVVRIDVREIPAFERFAIAFLNTHPARKFLLVGSGKNYRFVSRKNYLKRVYISVALLVVGGLAIWQIIIGA